MRNKVATAKLQITEYGVKHRKKIEKKPHKTSKITQKHLEEDLDFFIRRRAGRSRNVVDIPLLELRWF